MTLIPQIDEGACAGHADCAVLAPEVFRIDDIAVVVGSADDALLMQAAAACPSTAITLVDSETGAIAYP